MKKRIMIIGPGQSGKSSISNVLNESDRPLKKTQDVIYGKNTIDTPGAYIENASMYKYLIATAQTASCVLILVDQSRPVEVYPPRFAKTFTCPVLGVITKMDLVPGNEDWSRRQLQKIGVYEPYFLISLLDNTGVKELKDYLFGKKESSEED
ncbi:EutP/PduV family microcompartment system protein [Anaerospora sp.]|uniref:EutP/PduV family microcompartment system protein n=1 Tax=Anaerospora sp. TaxID=1960278 RepID=UPI0028A1CE2A|nr:EutP/PduV family microcompartment system protein [Anaerospora sp.]MDF2929139.1 pduV [Anaerospora sp.]